MNQRRRMFWLLGCLLVLLIWRIWDGMDEQGMPQLSPNSLFADNTPNARQERAIDILQSLPKLNFSPPGAAAMAEENQRNPFVFGIDKALEAKRQAQMEMVRAKLEAPPPMQLAPVPDVPASPEFSGSLFGMLYDQASDTRKAAIFMDEQVFLVGPGDQFLDDYQVESITQFEVIIQDLSHNLSHTLVLETDLLESWP